MTENIRKFLEEVSKNKELQDAVKKLNEKFPDKEKNKEKLLVLAQEYGLNLTAEDFSETPDNDRDHEISQSELESVVGGKYDNMVLPDLSGTKYMSNCVCAVGGGGSSDKYQKTCVCALAGVGELTDYGKQRADEGTLHYVGNHGAPVAMYCPVIGSAWNF